MSEIKICMGSSCFARGNAENLESVRQYVEENNLDAKIGLYGALCGNCCAEGPNIYIDGIKYTNATKEKIENLLKGITAE